MSSLFTKLKFGITIYYPIGRKPWFLPKNISSKNLLENAAGRHMSLLKLFNIIF